MPRASPTEWRVPKLTVTHDHFSGGVAALQYESGSPHKIQRTLKHLVTLGLILDVLAARTFYLYNPFHFSGELLQPSYQFSSGGGNFIGGIKPLKSGSPRKWAVLSVSQRQKLGPAWLEWPGSYV